MWCDLCVCLFLIFATDFKFAFAFPIVFVVLVVCLFAISNDRIFFCVCIAETETWGRTSVNIVIAYLLIFCFLPFYFYFYRNSHEKSRRVKRDGLWRIDIVQVSKSPFYSFFHSYVDLLAFVLLIRLLAEPASIVCFVSSFQKDKKEKNIFFVANLAHTHLVHHSNWFDCLHGCFTRLVLFIPFVSSLFFLSHSFFHFIHWFRSEVRAIDTKSILD